jgi:flagellum-specific peptidoglycan hydrolase FlgJ
MTREEHIEKYKQTVIEATKGTGLFPSVMMAQSILESANMKGEPGQSTLARLYNNFFGIKADKRWTGKKVNLKTREVFDGKSVMIGDYFRVYEDASRSFVDRNVFLRKNIRYTLAGVFDAKTPEEQAHALKRAGYATDPNYAKIIIGLINKHNLRDLDKQGDFKIVSQVKKNPLSGL